MITRQTSSSSFTFAFLSLSFVVLFISLSFLRFRPTPLASQTLTLNPALPNSTLPRPQAPRNYYIVRFLQYRLAGEHRAYLESGVPSDGWEWIERKNPAAKYPTDFGLVSIQELAIERVVGEIGKLGLVKDVNLDLSYRRDLLGEEKRARARVGAFVDGKKRPGKIFTAMSFSEGEGEGECHSAISNASVKLGRQLLIQVILSLIVGFVWLVRNLGTGKMKFQLGYLQVMKSPRVLVSEKYEI
jgi:membrane-bound transcription factor site-1 protease